MKNYYFFLLAFFSITSVSSQIINFPDANFKAKLLGSFLGAAQNINQQYIVIDANADGEIQVSEAQAVYYLNVSKSASQLSEICKILNTDQT